MKGASTKNSVGELHILGHDGNSIGVDGTKVDVLEEADHEASEAFWRARMAEDWKRSSFLYLEGFHGRLYEKGNFQMKSSLDFWKRLIKRRTTVPSLKRWGFLTTLVACCVFLAAAFGRCACGRAWCRSVCERFVWCGPFFLLII